MNGRRGNIKGIKNELICITVILFLSSITPLNQMQKTSFNIGGNDRQTSPNAMKLNKITPND